MRALWGAAGRRERPPERQRAPAAGQTAWAVHYIRARRGVPISGGGRNCVLWLHRSGRPAPAAGQAPAEMKKSKEV